MSVGVAPNFEFRFCLRRSTSYNGFIYEAVPETRMITLNAATADQDAVGWRFDNTYARLPEGFFALAQPSPASVPRVVIQNHALARDLGLNLGSISQDYAAALFSGQSLPDGAQPIAQAYAGHQYGHFTMLGDGRAILLGEHRTPSGQLVDIQLKGSGRTQYSRRGDGRAVLGPMLREYVISEAMFALGIPTTRSLAVVTTGDVVYRGTQLPGAILTRVAASHVRVGTFEYAAARQDAGMVRTLADYTLERHFPELISASDRYLQFFRAVVDRQAALLARWQLVGFVHGVMNTDNMAISGETIDYGPCAFMNVYRPDTVFSSIDHGGRYAYGNQPAIAQWNLARFAETLLPLLAPQESDAVALATAALGEFATLFEEYWLSGMQAKLGLETSEPGDRELIQTLLTWMQNSGADFTNTFRDLSDDRLVSSDRYTESEFGTWHLNWLQRLARELRPVSEIKATMRQVNPAVIPRNHKVEEALSAAEERGDLTSLHRLLDVLSRPFEATPDSGPYQVPPPDDRSYRTFCGT